MSETKREQVGRGGRVPQEFLRISLKSKKQTAVTCQVNQEKGKTDRFKH